MATHTALPIAPLSFDAKASPGTVSSLMWDASTSASDRTSSPLHSSGSTSSSRPRANSGAGPGAGAGSTPTHTYSPALTRPVPEEGEVDDTKSQASVESAGSLVQWSDDVAAQLASPTGHAPARARPNRKASTASSVEADHDHAPLTTRVASWSDGSATRHVHVGEWGEARLPGTPSSKDLAAHQQQQKDSSSGKHGVAAASLYPRQPGSTSRRQPRHLSRTNAAESFIVHKFQQSSYVRIEHNRLGDAHVVFQVSQFCVQLLWQCIPPLGMLVIWLLFGRQGLLNAELWLTQPRFYFQMFNFLGVAASALIYALVPSVQRVVSSDNVAFVVVTYALFRSVIALKYAYMPSGWYKMWYNRERSTYVVPETVRKRENLMRWMAADDDHVRAELAATAKRLGVCLHSASFSVVQPNVEDSEHDGQAVLTAPREEWSMLDAISEIMHSATKQVTMTPLTVFCIVFAVVHGFTASGVTACIMGTSPGPVTALEWTVVISLAGWSFVQAYTVAMFACSAFVDYQRQYYALAELEHAVSYHPKSTDNSGIGPFPMYAADTPPKVSLLITENVHMFLLARRVLLNLGLRYRKRLYVYTTVMVTFVFAVVVYFMVASLGRDFEPTTTMWVLAFDSVAVVGLLLACLLQGSATNQLTEKHTALLDARLMEVTDAISETRAASSGSLWSESSYRGLVVQQLTSCKHALRAAMSQLQHDHALRAVKLVGARASPALIRNMLVFGTTVGSLMLRLLLADG